MFFEKLYNLIYHIGFTAGSGFMKFGKWLSRGLSRPVKTVGAVFFAVFLVIDKFILKTFKTVSAEFKLLMADIKRVRSEAAYLYKEGIFEAWHSVYFCGKSACPDYLPRCALLHDRLLEQSHARS